jgi:FlaG/FlaF family flagellin (archaellin)
MKHFRSKKAVSPIVSVLLLIGIASAVSMILFVFVMNTIGTAQPPQPTLRGELSLDDYKVSVGGSTATLYVRNVGEANVTIASVYWDGGAASFTTDKPNNIVAPGDVVKISVTGLSSSQTSKGSHELTIACTDGTMLKTKIVVK